MAIVKSPNITFGNGQLPQGPNAVVPYQNIAPNTVVVYTGTILATPRSSQLVSPPTTGYPF